MVESQSSSQSAQALSRIVAHLRFTGQAMTQTTSITTSYRGSMVANLTLGTAILLLTTNRMVMFKKLGTEGPVVTLHSLSLEEHTATTTKLALTS